MPFIGNQPALSYTSFAKQDFTTSATTSYTLDNPVANANELALFINFVRQEPTTAYSASGTTLTLTSATSATDDMYCVFLGKAVQTVNPPNNSVNEAQLNYPLTTFSSTGIDDNATSTAITIDSSEQVGIGTSSPDAVLQVGTLGSPGSYRGALSIKTVANYTTLGEGAIYIEETLGSEGYYMGVDVNGGMFFNNSGAAGSTLYLGDDDNVGIGTSSPSNTLHVSGGNGTKLQSDSTIALNVYRTVSTSTVDVMHLNSDFGGTSTKNFQIEADGDVQNTNNSYGSLSDRRFKENETDANSQWEDIKSLQIKNYNLKIHPDIKHLGVIAQDLEASGMNGLVKNKPDVFYTEDDVLPEGKNVGDVKEENYKEVKYSILYMKSIKALQEAMERIEQLETKNTELEARITQLENA